MQIGDRIYQVMSNADMSTLKFSQTIHCGRTALDMWLSNSRIPPVHALVNICTEFEVSADWLMLGIGDMYRKKKR